MKDSFIRRIEAIEELARKEGLDFFPVVFEEVPRDIIWDIASYGLPTRMSHWSFGKSFLHQKTYGEMGYGKIYELILNNNPSYAFLDDTNPDVVNLLVAAHCIGHSSFFKKNACFSKTNRNMVNQAEMNAKVIEDYKNKYGIEQVENWMDIAFALDRHIDWYLGEERSLYPEAEIRSREKHPLPYADLFGESDKPQVVEELINTEFPPHPEGDILWFLINYAKMLPWQKEVFSIIRSESFYFYPQALTKVMNEGWASFWHAELMLRYQDLTPEEHLDFSKAHAGVVSAGSPGSFNPYYVGFRIFTDIRERWDKYYEEGQKDTAFVRSSETERRDEHDKVVMSKLTGMQKIFQVMEDDDDVSFISNYLTLELIKDMKLFTYGYAGTTSVQEDDDIILKERDAEEIRKTMTQRLHNYGAPKIVISKVDNGELHLTHDKAENMPLDEQYTTETLRYIQEVWKNTVVLHSYDRFGKDLVYKRTNSGISKENTEEYGKEIDLRM